MSNLSKNITRRSVLKGVGVTAVGGTGIFGLSGTAAAHRIDEVTFCGCSQVCVCGKGELYVWFAEETENGFSCYDEQVESGPETDFSTCVEVDDGAGKKIIAIEDGHDMANEDEEWAGSVYLNPNNCASKPLEDCDGLEESKKVSDVHDGNSGGPCGDKFLRNCGEEDDERGPPDNKPENGQPDDNPGNGPPDDNPGQGPPDDDERGPSDDNPGRGNGGGPGK